MSKPPPNSYNPVRINYHEAEAIMQLRPHQGGIGAQLTPDSVFPKRKLSLEPGPKGWPKHTLLDEKRKGKRYRAVVLPDGSEYQYSGGTGRSKREVLQYLKEQMDDS